MKYFLIGFVIYFAIAWLSQFVKAWYFNLLYAWKKKHHPPEDDWMYEVI